MKRCNRCRVTKPEEDFEDDPRNPGTKRTRCRKCMDHVRGYYKTYRSRSIKNELDRQQLIGRPAINAYKRAHHRERPESVLLQNARQRARKGSFPCDLTLADIHVPERCPILGIPIQVGSGRASPNSPSLDRIDPSGGYTVGNVMVVSHRANTIKSDATPEELRKVADFLEATYRKNSSAQQN